MKRCTHCKGTGIAPNWKRLGEFLRENREHIKISLRKLARDCDMSAAHLSDMELGNRGIGGPKGLRALKRMKLSFSYAFSYIETTIEDYDGDEVDLLFESFAKEDVTHIDDAICEIIENGSATALPALEWLRNKVAARVGVTLRKEGSINHEERATW